MQLVCYLVCVLTAALVFFLFTAAEDDEIGPDGKRIQPGITSSIISELTECNAALSQQRKRDR